jgi:serine phosphatase RsbU (regulator of sigma subunit)
MNRALRGILRQLGTTLFTTACYIIVDIQDGKITFANAGHPSPLLVHRAAGSVEPITARREAGPALGLFEEVQYLTYALPVQAGDILLAFTDGLFEAENAEAEAFSAVRLRESIRSRKSLPLEQLMQDVFSEIKNFTEDQVFSDDVCFVGMEIRNLVADRHRLPA